MGGRRPAPRVINKPTGPRRPREDSRDESRVRFPRPRDIYRPVGAVDKEGNPVPGFDPRRKPSAPDTTERREETSGDSFRESRRERRMAGDRKGFFGRVPKRPGEGFLGTRLPIPTGRPTRGDRPGGFPTRGPAPDTRDRGPSEKTRKIFEAMRDRGFGMTINMSKDATPDQRKAAFDRLLEERRGSMRPFPRRNQDQNIAKTDV